MAATLDAIESALLAELATMKAPSSGPTLARPFRHVGRWAGEVTREHGVEENTLNASPAALLAYEGSDPVGRDGAYVETGGHLVEVVEEHRFLVYVVVADQRSDDITLKGTNVVPGVLLCARRVKEALAGLVIPGLFDGGVVALEGHRPWLIERGVQHTHVVRVSARSALPESADTTPDAPFTFDGRVRDAAPDSDGGAVPLAAVRVTPP